MKQLTSTLPLCYNLPNSSLITALPYIDQQYPEYKNRIQYLIKGEQEAMGDVVVEDYVKELKLPDTPFVSSHYFEGLVQRVKGELAAKAEKQKQKDKKPTSIFQNINLATLSNPSQIPHLQKCLASHQKNLLKQINLQLYQQLAPQIQKQSIGALDKKKQVLMQEIEKQKAKIEEINRNRRYMQLEARERENTVRERLKVMIYKGRKVND